MKGLSSTIGITHRAFNLKEEDGVIVSAMKEGGLIPFTKSNVAQLAMTF
jgi:Asp-tRNA(Asn)/Glu-tRNA(Gln) amidotransferase A subunit family amidase